MSDLIDRIDALTTPTCAECNRALRDNGPSADFCGETCAEHWRARQADTGVPFTDRLRTQPAGRPVIHASDPMAWMTDGTVQMTDLTRDLVDGFREFFLSQGRPQRTDGDPPATAVLIGGQRHGQTIGIPTPPRATLDVIEEVQPGRILFDSDNLQVQRITYWLVTHNGAHWCYVDPRPAAPSRTIHVDGHAPLTIDYHYYDLQRVAWWVTITGPTRGIVCELPNELLTHDTALVAWFEERAQHTGWATTPGSTTVPPLPIYILALNYQIAVYAARNTLCLQPNQWRHIDSADRLRGLDHGRYHIDQSFNRHPHADEIRAVLASRHMTAITVRELNALNHNAVTDGFLPTTPQFHAELATDGSWDVTDQQPPWSST